MSNSTVASIVVGITGSPASLRALRYALSEGASSGAAVHVIHCWHVQSMRDVAFGSTHELHNASLCMLDNEVSSALRDTVGAVTVTKTSFNGRPAAVLVEQSKDAELLVLGAHGHTTLRDAAFGQVEASCRKRAWCPVAVVGADGRASRYESNARALIAH